MTSRANSATGGHPPHRGHFSSHTPFTDWGKGKEEPGAGNLKGFTVYLTSQGAQSKELGNPASTLQLNKHQEAVQSLEGHSLSEGGILTTKAVTGR